MACGLLLSHVLLYINYSESATLRINNYFLVEQTSKSNNIIVDSRKSGY